MANTVYTPGSTGQYWGYDQPFAQRAVQAQHGRVIYPQWKKGGTLVQLDLIIVNSMTTALNIELFNFFRSQTKLYVAQNQANNYYPIGIDDLAGQPGATNGTYANAAITFGNTTTNGYEYGIFAGAYDAFVAVGKVPTGSTRNQVFFDIYGNLVYQPGYAGGAIPSGNVIVSVQQMPYLQLFEFTSTNKLIIDCIKFTFNSQAQTQQMAQTVYHKYFSSTGIATNTENYTPSTFFNEQNFQSNIITVPVDKMITNQWGMWYNQLGQLQATNTQTTMTMFLWIDNEALLTTSNPRA